MVDSIGSSTTMRGSKRRILNGPLLRRLRGGELDYDGPVKICRCGLVAPLCTSWTNINPGRGFFGCQNYQQGGSCGFFQWHDDEMSERSIVVINELLSHVDSLQDEVVGLRRNDEKELGGGVKDELSGIYAEMRKCKRRLKFAFFALALTWVFMFVFFYMK